MPVFEHVGAKALQIVRNTQTATTDGESWYDNLRKTAAKVDVTQERALRVTAVYAAVSRISDNCASLPVKITARGDASRTPVRPPKYEALWGKPNHDQTRIQFLQQGFVSLLLWGNAYVYLGWTNGGQLFEQWVISPDRVRLWRDDDYNLRMEIKGYREGRYSLINRRGELPEFMHVPAMTLPGFIQGLSPIEYARETIGSALAGEVTAGSLLSNGLRLDAVIQAKGKLEEGEARRIGSQFRARHSDGVNTVAVIDQDATVTKLAISPVDAQFLEQQKYHVTDIARLYGIPPHLIGYLDSSTVWGSGMEESNTQFAVLTLRPWLVRWEQAVEDTILAGTELDLHIVIDGLARGSMRERYEAYRVALDGGWESPNTVLEKEDRAPIEGGDMYRSPLNFGPASLHEVKLLAARAEAAGVLIRAGYDPDDASRLVGLEGIRHTGAAPITVQSASAVEDDVEMPAPVEAA